LNVPDDVDERIRSLRARGDDYLTRPYDSGELMARLEGLIRRSQEPGTSVSARADTLLRAGPLALDLAARKVTRDGVEIALLPTECRVLEFMMRRVGQTVTRMMLFEAVWSYHFDPGTNLIEVHMSKLRKKIDMPDKESLLKTVRGAGYVLSI
jgi:two-component system OmpR family response regulator